jgi:hypothetical protein
VEKRVALFEPPTTTPAGESSLFQFPADGVGELLRQKLTPGHSPGMEPIPFVSEPREWRSARLSERAVRYEFPSALSAGDAAHVLAMERSSAVCTRRVLDVPLLATETEPALPARPEFPVGPRAYAIGPDPSQPPATELMAPVHLPANVIDDPTSVFSRRTATAVIDAARTQLVPYPSPDSSANHPRIGTSSSTEPDAPAVTTARPAIPPLPVK